MGSNLNSVTDNKLCVVMELLTSIPSELMSSPSEFFSEIFQVMVFVLLSSISSTLSFAASKLSA